MTEREKVLLQRQTAVTVLLSTPSWRSEQRKASPEFMPVSELLDIANKEAIRLFPLPTRTVPTVRQGVAEGGRWWYRVLVSGGNQTVYRYHSEGAARNGSLVAGGWWPPEDQPTVAALLALPLTEEVEDTGKDGAK